MTEHVCEWMAWRHIDADRFLTDTIQFFKCRDCNKRMEVSEVECRLNATERLNADDARLSRHTGEETMKGVADRTLELMNEFQKEQYIKSYQDFQHFLVVKIEQLEDENEALRMSESYYRIGATQTKIQAKRPEYVPKRIFIPRTVRSDIPNSSVAVHRGEYDAHVNQYGAVSIKITDDSFLGIMLYEFDVIEWQINPALLKESE